MSKNPSTILKIFFTTIIIVSVLGYAIFNTRLFIQGPQIIISSPISGETSDEKLIEISGQVLNSSFISINDRAILIDEHGNFTESILLYGGHNIILIKANDKFDREVTEQLNLVYNMPEGVNLVLQDFVSSDLASQYPVKSKGVIDSNFDEADEATSQEEDPNSL